MLLGDLPEWRERAAGRIREHKVEPTHLLSDDGVESIEIREPRDVALYSGDVTADLRDGRVEPRLAPASDEDPRAFGDEALGGGGESDAGGASSDQGDLAGESSGRV